MVGSQELEADRVGGIEAENLAFLSIFALRAPGSYVGSAPCTPILCASSPSGPPPASASSVAPKSWSGGRAGERGRQRGKADGKGGGGGDELVVHPFARHSCWGGEHNASWCLNQERDPSPCTQLASSLTLLFGHLPPRLLLPRRTPLTLSYCVPAPRATFPEPPGGPGRVWRPRGAPHGRPARRSPRAPHACPQFGCPTAATTATSFVPPRPCCPGRTACRPDSLAAGSCARILCGPACHHGQRGSRRFRGGTRCRRERREPLPGARARGGRIRTVGFTCCGVRG